MICAKTTALEKKVEDEIASLTAGLQVCWLAILHTSFRPYLRDSPPTHRVMLPPC